MLLMMPRVALHDGVEISRIIKGGWHLAGGHGSINPDAAKRDMAAFVDAGITTFDCADIYNGVEQLIGEFRRHYPDHARRIQVFTKFVPDLQDLPVVNRSSVERVINRSLRRLGIERLDCVQFHWWDFSIPRYIEIAFELQRLQVQGKIRLLSVTNFDVAHLSEILDAGILISTHQLQYSLLDRRPESRMVDFCRKHNIKLLCYGTVAGGWLSERWLGQPEPSETPQNRSLVKYKLIIDEFWGWPRFQQLLETLSAIARKHSCDIASIATRFILDQPGVAAAIIGATNTAHLPSLTELESIHLDDQDAKTLSKPPVRNAGIAGDVYSLERDRAGKHGRIMKYNLNQGQD